MKKGEASKLIKDEALNILQNNKIVDKIMKDKIARNNPNMAKSILKMIARFGKWVLTEKKECFRCGKKKHYFRFSFRKNRKDQDFILGVCRECESERTYSYQRKS